MAPRTSWSLPPSISQGTSSDMQLPDSLASVDDLHGLNDAVFSLRVESTRLDVSPDDAITAVAAAGGVLWVGTQSGRLLRHTPSTGQTSEVRGRLGVGRLDNAVWRIYADPVSQAALVILRNADGYHTRGTGPVRPRWLAKLRGLRCVSASWVRVPCTDGAGDRAVALLGTAFGAVFSLVVDEKNERDDVLARLWAVPGGEAVRGLRVERVAGKFVGVVATGGELFLFSDALKVEELFMEERMSVVKKEVGRGEDRPGEGQGEGAKVEEEREGGGEDGREVLPAELQFMTSNSGVASRRFVWAGEAGVTHAQLAVRRRRNEKPSESEVTVEVKASRSTVMASVMDLQVISWETLKKKSGSAVPLACNLSAFHVLVLYPGSVYAFNQISGHLTQRVTVWSPGGALGGAAEGNAGDWSARGNAWKRRPSPIMSESLHKDAGGRQTSYGWEDAHAGRGLSSPAAGFARDVATDALWIYTADGEFGRLVASDEEQNEAWKAAKAMRRFDLAMALAPLVSGGMPDDERMFQTREAVLEAQADHAASQGDWDVAAQLYAKTNRPVETVILDIVEACYASSKAGSSSVSLPENSSLSALGVGPRLAMTKHVIMYLVRKLDKTSSSKPMQRTIIGTMLVQLYASRLSSEISDSERKAVCEDFGHFLADRHADLDVQTSLTILCRNGCYDEAWKLAVLSGDILSASELSSRRGSIDQTLSLLKTPLVTSDDDTLSRLIRNLSSSLVPQAPYKASAAIARALTPTSTATATSHTVDHMATVQGLARVARGVKNTHTAREAYRAATIYLFDLLHEWPAVTGASAESARDATTVGETDTRTDWFKLVTFLFQLHAEFGSESEAQRSYDYLVTPRLHKPICTLMRHALGAILRSARSGEFRRLCVSVYQALDMHETAIELAVTLDAQLAESKVSLLSQTRMDEGQQRALWALVASRSGDAVGVAERSCGVLHIEDVLTTMAAFQMASERVKTAVAESLQEHKRLANAAKAAAAAALQVTASLREDLEAVRKCRGGKARGERGEVRAFACGHRVTSGGWGGGECGACGRRAIEGLDAPFRGGPELTVEVRGKGDGS